LPGSASFSDGFAQGEDFGEAEVRIPHHADDLADEVVRP